MVTIKQIANLSGVSRGTVDRVLNNRGGVNPQTAQKIREIAKMLNYTPNKVGQNLAVTKKNLRLGMILIDSKSGNPFIQDVIAGADEKTRELEDYGVSVELMTSKMGMIEQQLACIAALEQQKIDGLAIMPENHPRIAEKLRELKEKGIAVVTVNTDIDNSGRLAYVGSNYRRSGETAAGLMNLVTGGAAEIGIVTGSTEILCHAERIAGFQKRIRERYPRLHIAQIVGIHDDDVEGLQKTKQMLQENPNINALYLTAGGVYGCCRAVQNMGLRGKIKIICFDAMPTTCQLLRDGVVMAAIDQQPQKQGRLALDLLFAYLGMGTEPENEYCYTENSIKIAENLT